MTSERPQFNNWNALRSSSRRRFKQLVDRIADGVDRDRLHRLAAEILRANDDAALAERRPAFGIARPEQAHQRRSDRRHEMTDAAVVGDNRRELASERNGKLETGHAERRIDRLGLGKQRLRHRGAQRREPFPLLRTDEEDRRVAFGRERRRERDEPIERPVLPDLAAAGRKSHIARPGRQTLRCELLRRRRHVEGALPVRGTPGRRLDHCEHALGDALRPRPAAGRQPVGQEKARRAGVEAAVLEIQARQQHRREPCA